MSDTPETDAMEYFDAMCDPDRVVAADFARRLERQRDEATRSCHIWQQGHSNIVNERDLWKVEAKRWRDMYIEYDEMLDEKVNEAVTRLEDMWDELDKLKQKLQDDFLDGTNE